MSTTIATVLENIKVQRALKGYSQEYLAAKLNVSQNAYSKMELGYTQLSLLRLFQIVEVLEVDIEEVLDQPGSLKIDTERYGTTG